MQSCTGIDNLWVNSKAVNMPQDLITSGYGICTCWFKLMWNLSLSETYSLLKPSGVEDIRWETTPCASGAMKHFV